MEGAGSRFYCAPELREGRYKDDVTQMPADVYSLGKLLYWMVSGKQMFDRENYRDAAYRIGQGQAEESSYELVNQLFDKAIVSSPSSRIQNAIALQSEVVQLLAVLRAGGHAISLEVPHRCLFCAQGDYKIDVNGLESGTAQSGGGQASSEFGWAAPAPYPAWLIMVRETCGHVQTFRTDLPKGPNTGARMQFINAKKQQWLKKRNP